MQVLLSGSDVPARLPRSIFIEAKVADSARTSSSAYLFRCAAFHFAQRARWAAAIRLRAAADIVLRFLPGVFARAALPTRPRKLLTPLNAFKASSICSILRCA